MLILFLNPDPKSGLARAVCADDDKVSFSVEFNDRLAWLSWGEFDVHG
jgi:hypothetical protein